MSARFRFSCPGVRRNVIGSHQLRPRVKTQANVRSYFGRMREANGSEFGRSISFASSRKIVFDGLIAGLT